MATPTRSPAPTHRLAPVPSSITGDLYFYLMQVRQAVNQIPHSSYFSGPTPNSVVSGLAGHLAINIGSASSDSRVWVMGGNSLSAWTNTGWVVLRTSA